MHITTHAEIDRTKTVSELINTGVNLQFELQRHYAHSSYPYPTHGVSAERADLEVWRHFFLDEVYDLPVLGLMAQEARRRADGSTRPASAVGFRPEWGPGIFAVKIEGNNGRSPVTLHHLLPLWPPNGSEDDDLGADEVFEVGVGQLKGDKKWWPPGSEFLAGWSVVLRRANVSGTERLSARTYQLLGDSGIWACLAASELPDDSTCRDFLQMHRNAMWNSVSEPA